MRKIVFISSLLVILSILGYKLFLDETKRMADLQRLTNYYPSNPISLQNNSHLHRLDQHLHVIKICCEV